LAAAILLLMAAVVVPGFAQVTIDNLAAWNGNTAVSSFGIGVTQTYGQMITVLTGSTKLLTFGFEVRLPPQRDVAGRCIYAF
jgi:hypothetical protein